MKNGDKKRILCLTLIFLTAAFIWGNSLLPAELSARLSAAVMKLLGGVSDKQEAAAEGSIHLLRKLAHFTEFLLLGGELCWLFLLLGEKGIHTVAMPLLAGALTACVDETIQLFVAGRGSSLVDVWIDIGGVTAGIMLLILGHTIKQRKTILEDNQ